MLKVKKSIVKADLFVLLFFGLLLILLFFSQNLKLVQQNITNWPKAVAKVISIEKEYVCETPEVSGACYNIFFIKYSYNVNNKEYIRQTKPLLINSYYPGEKFNVYYDKNNLQLSFIDSEIPTKADLHLPLVFGLIIVGLVIIGFYLKNKTKSNTKLVSSK